MHCKLQASVIMQLQIPVIDIWHHAAHHAYLFERPCAQALRSQSSYGSSTGCIYQVPCIYAHGMHECSSLLTYYLPAT